MDIYTVYIIDTHTQRKTMKIIIIIIIIIIINGSTAKKKERPFNLY